MHRELIRTGYSTTNLLLAFAAGAAVGAVAALLLAPAAGSDTRSKVAEAARDAARKPKDLARRVTGAVREGAAAAEEELDDVLARAR
jgi:gas vesicle protein